MRGSYATNLILQGAKPELMSRQRQVYSKPGGYMAAIDDYHSLEPARSQMLVMNDQVYESLTLSMSKTLDMYWIFLHCSIMHRLINKIFQTLELLKVDIRIQSY